MNEIALRLAARIFDKPLITNMYRSEFIEAMIESYLTPRGWKHVGDDWDGWDFERGEKGEQRLEIKQSAAHQTWSEPRNRKTRGAFDIAPRTAGYFSENAFKFTAITAPTRCAQTYLFAWNPWYGRDASGNLTVDHRNPDQWEFYVVPTTIHLRKRYMGNETVCVERAHETA
jgi:hypothetical protein